MDGEGYASYECVSWTDCILSPACASVDADAIRHDYAIDPLQELSRSCRYGVSKANVRTHICGLMFVRDWRNVPA